MSDTIKYTVDADGIALLTFDLSGKSMNVLTPRVMQDLEALVKKAAGDNAVKGLVLTSGKTGSCRFSSSILTKPPKGNSPMQYSVSRPRNRTSFGPKPMENISTLTPKTLAHTKCPSSCTKMSTETSTAK